MKPMGSSREGERVGRGGGGQHPSLCCGRARERHVQPQMLLQPDFENANGGRSLQGEEDTLPRVALSLKKVNGLHKRGLFGKLWSSRAERVSCPASREMKPSQDRHTHTPYPHLSGGRASMPQPLWLSYLWGSSCSHSVWGVNRPFGTKWPSSFTTEAIGTLCYLIAPPPALFSFVGKCQLKFTPIV